MSRDHSTGFFREVPPVGGAAWELSDEMLRAVAASAELPPLLATLAQITGDRRYLGERLRPPLLPMGATIARHGGMDDEAVALARELAFEGLRSLRDGHADAAADNVRLIDEILAHLTHQPGETYRELLRHELGIPDDVGSPQWRADELAPDREFRVLIIGAGISGLIAAHRLHQAGVAYLMVEKNHEVGGTWLENTYPGCRLDTPNYAYSFSFAQKPDWPHHYSGQKAIFDYLVGVSHDAGLRSDIRFATEVTAARFDEVRDEWEADLRTATGGSETVRVNAIISAVGQLNRPHVPEIAGLANFGGVSFHSAAWNHDVELRGKRVAVIGTGASAYQIVPAIADEVQHLTVFQRSAPWMLPTPNYHEDISGGLQWLFDNLPNFGRWYRFWQFWVSAEGRLPLVKVDPEWTAHGSISAANDGLRRELCQNLVEQFGDDPELLAAVTPNYPPGAKRMLRDNGVWGEALRKPHVELVSEPIERATQSGLATADGAERQFDIIVFATGFKAQQFLHPITVTGQGGVTLEEYWQGDARAYATITVPNFPNLFILLGPNAGLAANGSIIFMSECAVEYTLECLKTVLAEGAGSLVPTQEALDAFCSRIDAANEQRAWGVPGVSTWYKNATGRVSQNWPLDLVDYWDLTRRPDLTHYSLMRGGEVLVSSEDVAALVS